MHITHMQHSTAQTRATLIGTFITMLLCGCGSGQSDATGNTPSSSSATIPARQAGSPALDTQPKLPTPATRQEQVAALQATIADLQTERNAATLKQTRAHAQLDTHQRDSQALLESFKKRMAAERNAGEREALSEQARNELEQALALDQEYIAQAGAADAEAAELETRLSVLREQLRASQTHLEQTQAKTTDTR